MARRATMAQIQCLFDYFDYEIIIDGDAKIAKVFSENGVYLYDVRLV